MQYAKLRGKIREVYGTNNIFAKEIGMHPSVLSSKLNVSLDVLMSIEMNRGAGIKKENIDYIIENNGTIE